MDGFLYADNTNAMRYWDRSDIPFYWSLAETFPSCDRWFASAPRRRTRTACTSRRPRART